MSCSRKSLPRSEMARTPQSEAAPCDGFPLGLPYKLSLLGRGNSAMGKVVTKSAFEASSVGKVTSISLPFGPGNLLKNDEVKTTRSTLFLAWYALSRYRATVTPPSE